MSVQKWIKTSDEYIADNLPYWEYRRAKFVIPSGKEIDYQYIKHPGGSMIVGVNQEGRVAVVNQYRAIIEKESLEFPAGGRKEGYDPLKTAAEEFAEEAGHAARKIEHVGDIEISPGMTTMVASMFVASELEPVESERDETEEFDLFWLTPAEIDEMIADHRIKNAWTISAWVLAKPKVLEIISLQK